MENDPQKILEELIHRELSKLPERPAPSTLVPRILAEIKAREHRHWWQRPWSNWPFMLKVLSLPVLVGGAGMAVFLVTLLWNLIASHSGSFSPLAQQVDALSAVWDVLGALGNAALLLVRSISQQWLTVALVMGFGMYLACVGLGTLCYRMVSQSR